MSTYKRLNRMRGETRVEESMRHWMEHVIEWCVRSRKKILLGASLVVLVVLVLIGVSSYLKNRNETAVRLYYEAHRLEAKEDRSKALRALVDEYATTPMGRLAMLELGGLLQEASEHEAAKLLFLNLADSSSHHPLLKVAALHALAGLEWSRGEYASAAEYYHRASVVPKNLLRLESRYQQALCLEQLGQYDKATSIYRDIHGQASESALKGLAEGRLLWMAAQAWKE